MTDGADDEAHVALLTAGLVSMAIGVFVAMLPSGLVLGLVLGAAGMALAAVMTIILVRNWRRLTPTERQSRRSRSDSSVNLEEVLRTLTIVSGVLVVMPTLFSLLAGGEERWGTVMVSAPVFVIAGAWYVVVRRRNRRVEMETSQ